jgi:MFS family permease
VLILIGGAVADRHDRRSLLIGLHLTAALLSAGLTALVASAQLTLSLLLVYAVAAGSVLAFVMPARDALLSEVAGPNLMRAVTGLTLVQWGAQAVGSLVAGAAHWVGTVPALGAHCLIVFSGVFPLRRLSPVSPAPGASRRQLRLVEIVEGVQEVWRSPILLPVFLLVTAVGILFIGPFLVVFPILVRDYYGGDIGQLALLNMMFPLGTIIGSAGLLWYGYIRWKGAAQLGALVGGSFCLGAIALGLPLWGTLAAGCIWGISAAVFSYTGRTIFQEQAPPSHRARVLSVYVFGFMGASGLIGAPLAGVLVARIGPLATCAAASGMMLTVLACTFLFTNVSRME